MATVYASVVEQYVDATVSTRDTGEDPLNRVRVSHVGGGRFSEVPDFFGDPRRCGLVCINNHNMCSRYGKGMSDRSTDATTATGYDCDLIFQQKIRERKKRRFLSKLVHISVISFAASLDD